MRVKPSDLDKHLAHLRGEQAARRTKIHDVMESTELRAARDLAFELFGPLGVVEWDPNPITNERMGPLRISVFTEPVDPSKPKQLRRTRPMFQGATVAELVAQAELWRKGRR